MIAFVKKYPFATLMFVSLLMLVPHLGLIQTNIMEARNLITAREMVSDGHWIFTTINGMPRYEKPPLPTWLTAIFGYICGFGNMFVLRLPVVLVTLMMVYFFYRLTKYMQFKNDHSLNASLILITSFYIFFAGRDNQWDMYTHAFMVACIFFLFKSFRETSNVTKNIFISGILFGCSFLSKGPVSFYALFLPFLLSYFFVYRSNAGRNLKLLLFVLIIGLIIGFSWPLYVRFFDTANVHAALSQQAQNWGDYEVKPFWHYWSFFTQSGIWTIPALISLMFFYMRKRVEDVKAYTFSFWWTILSVILLSLIPEKKMRYLLPVLIPLALNTSFYIQYLVSNFRHIKNKFETGIVYFSFGLISLIAIALPFVVFFMFKEKLNTYIFWYVALTVMSIAFSIIIFRGLFQKNFTQVFYAVVFFMCALIITVIPLSKIFYSNQNYFPAANLNAVEKNLHIKTYEAGDFIPEIIWDYGKSIPSLSNNKSILMPKDSLFGLLISSEESKQLIQNFKSYSFRKYAVVDLNEISNKSKGYNTRLVKDYFVVKRLNLKNIIRNTK